MGVVCIGAKDEGCGWAGQLQLTEAETKAHMHETHIPAHREISIHTCLPSPVDVSGDVLVLVG